MPARGTSGAGEKRGKRPRTIATTNAAAIKGSGNNNNNNNSNNRGGQTDGPGPSHVLFAEFVPSAAAGASSTHPTSTTESKAVEATITAGFSQSRFFRNSIDPFLENDYIGRRKRAGDGIDWTPTTTSTATPITKPTGKSTSKSTAKPKPKTKTNTAVNPDTNRSTVRDPWWDGASGIERELVACCEPLLLGDTLPYLESDEDDSDHDEPEPMAGDHLTTTAAAETQSQSLAHAHSQAHVHSPITAPITAPNVSHKKPKDNRARPTRDELVRSSSLALSVLLSSSSSSSPTSSGLQPANRFVGGGVLAIEKEIAFAAHMSRSCHTMAARCLALAILERSLEAYLVEEASAISGHAEHGSGNGRPTDDRSPKRRRLKAEPSTHQPSGEESAASSRAPHEEEEMGIERASNSSLRRFENFFAAGGLRILGHWLSEAASCETAAAPSITLRGGASAGSGSKPGGRSPTRTRAALVADDATTTDIRTPSATRPLALSILRFLEHIPFQKKTVTNSKINKQVQKLGKKIESLQEQLLKQQQQQQQQQQKQQQEVSTTTGVAETPALDGELEYWTTDPSVSHQLALTNVGVAVDAVKASWREKAKAAPGKTTAGKKKQEARDRADPFGPLKSQIRERLELLAQLENGTLAEPPSWYRPEAANSRSSNNKNTRSSTNPTPTSEDEAERLRLELKIKQMQSRSQKSLQQLRERLMQRKTSDQSTLMVLPKTHKGVVWKDGMKSQITRNRKKLEDVCVFWGDDVPSVARPSREDDG